MYGERPDDRALLPFSLTFRDLPTLSSFRLPVAGSIHFQNIVRRAHQRPFRFHLLQPA